MNDILKQRLVGALVIIAGAALLWPAVFIDPEPRSVDRSTQIPPRPVLAERPLAPPQRLSGVPAVADSDGVRDAPPAGPSDPAVADNEAAGKGGAADSATADADATATADKTAPPARPQPALDDSGIPIAWALRVVTVGERSRAGVLTAELIERGYKAWYRPHQRDNGKLYQVYVGPLFDKAKLQLIQREVDARLQVKSIITRYKP